MEALLEDMQDIQERTVVPATVVSVSHAEAWVSIDAKQDVPILKKELAYPEPDSAEDVVKVGDVIEVSEKSRQSVMFKRLTGEDAPVFTVPTWLEKEKNVLKGTVVRMPAREDIDLPIEEHLIVELYSK